MMHWSSLGEFLAMGGYAVYVWGSLLMTAFLLGGEQLLLARRRGAISPESGSRPAAPVMQSEHRARRATRIRDARSTNCRLQLQG